MSENLSINRPGGAQREDKALAIPFYGVYCTLTCHCSSHTDRLPVEADQLSAPPSRSNQRVRQFFNLLHNELSSGAVSPRSWRTAVNGPADRDQQSKGPGPPAAEPLNLKTSRSQRRLLSSRGEESNFFLAISNSDVRICGSLSAGCAQWKCGQMLINSGS